MTLVKICGIKDAATALETAKAGADFIGVVFAESKRRVTPQQCHDIVEAIKENRTQGRDGRRASRDRLESNPTMRDFGPMKPGIYKPTCLRIKVDTPQPVVDAAAKIRELRDGSLPSPARHESGEGLGVRA